MRSLLLLKKQLHKDLKIKFNGKKLYAADSVKQLKIQIEKNLTWKDPTNYVAIRKKYVLSPLCNFEIPFRSCFSCFGKKTPTKSVYILQKIPQENIFSRNSHSFVLLGDLKIIKFFDKFALENCIFISRRGNCHHSSATGLNVHLNHT